MCNQNSTLQRLDLSGNISLEDDGCRELLILLVQGGCELVQLDLSGTGFSDTASEACRELLETNQSLRKLQLTTNSISDWGVNQLVQALLNNGTLLHLDLRLNETP